MSRIRTLFTVVVPSMLAGGLIFGSAFGHASAGRDDLIGYWPAASDATATGAAKKVPPPPPALPVPPTPPTPPSPKHGAGGGVSVSIKDGKVEVDGIEDLVNGQIDAALRAIKDAPGMPPAARAELEQKMAKLRAKLKARFGKLDLSDMDAFGKQMDQFGKEMDAFGKEMEKWGDQFGKDMGKQMAKRFTRLRRVDADDDDDDTGIPMAPDVDIDVDDSDLKDAIQELKDVALKPVQRDAIGKLRADSDKTVAAAKKQLDDLSDKLHAALGNPATSDADIAKYVDQISAQEATIRKARLLAWANARRVLDDAQRKKIEDAAKKKTK